MLWKEYNNYKLSAGRVQSVVVRIIAEREAEIEKFSSSSYYKITANFVLDKSDLTKSKANFIETVCEEDIKDRQIVENLYKKCADGSANFTIKSVAKTNSKRNASPPYCTSTLQQDASVKLGMSPDSCMKTAQKLYEAGLITYMRTDALFIAEEAMKNIKTFVETKWGVTYYRRMVYKTKSASSQEAHEACRPTDISKESITHIEGMTAQHNRLYQLIWRRTVASQMAPADIEIRTVKISDSTQLETSTTSVTDETSNKKIAIKKGKKKSTENTLEIIIANDMINEQSNVPVTFVGKHEKVIFEGYLSALNFHKKKATSAVIEEQIEDGAEEQDDDADDTIIQNSEYLEAIFAKLKVGDPVWSLLMDCMEKYTKPPHARYTEASLIKKLDELQIGRPATYASMVHKVQEEQRQYVERKTLPAKKVKLMSLKYSYPDKIVITEKDTKIEGDKNKLFPTALGIMINDYLVKNFEDIMNYKFTANVESLLDEIAEGKKIWHHVVDSVYIKLNPIIDQLAKAVKARKIANADAPDADSANRRFLGNHPETNLPIYSLKSRKGYLVCESNPDKALSRFGNFASKFEDMNLEQALLLLIFPKTLGQYKDKDVIVKKAKNVYLSHDNVNFSIEYYLKANENVILDVNNITLDDAIEILKYYETSKAQQIADAQNDRKLDDSIVVKTGRFGPYIKYQGTMNIPLPKALKERWQEITIEECKTVIENNANKKSIGAKSIGAKSIGAKPKSAAKTKAEAADATNAKEVTTKSKSVAKPKAKPKVEAKTKPKAEVKLKPKAKPKAEAKPKTS
jgi:DNA topoisomerase-1